jgi:ArsR family transcriptional regulator
LQSAAPPGDPEIFHALAYPAWIAIVEALRDREISAGHLIEKLGAEQTDAWQHFAVLRGKQIVTSRKDGNQVCYSLRGPVLIDVLDFLKRYFNSELSQTMSMLKENQTEKAATQR